MDKAAHIDKRLAAHLVKCQRAHASNPSCMINWVDKCSRKAINSHLISKSSLMKIADKGHVTTYAFDLFNILNNPDPTFKEIGIGKASTFKGFCSHHDASLFELIDRWVQRLDEKLDAKRHFRGLAHELWQKSSAHGQLSSYDLLDENFQKDETQTRILESVSLGVRDFLYQYYDTATDIIRDRIKNWKFLHIKAPITLPFSYTGPLNVDVFPQYNRNEPDPSEVYPAITVSVLPLFDQTSISLVCKGTPTPGMKVLFNRFQYARKNLPEVLLQFGLEHVERIYFKPSWFASVSKQFLDEIVDLTHQNTRPSQYNWISINKRPLYGIFNEANLINWRFKTNSNYARRIIKALRS